MIGRHLGEFFHQLFDIHTFQALPVFMDLRLHKLADVMEHAAYIGSPCYLLGDRLHAVRRPILHMTV